MKYKTDDPSFLFYVYLFSAARVRVYPSCIYPIQRIVLENITLEYLFEGCTPQTRSDVYIQLRDFNV